MKSHQQKRTHLPRSSRLLNAALLLALILGLVAPSGVLAADPTWEFQGPAPQQKGQQDLLMDPDEPVSGAVRVIIPSPTDADLVYLAGSNGGVWKTTNATDSPPTWTPLTDDLMSQSIGDMSLDPTDATGQTLVVGTARFSAFARRGDDLAGLYYTTDGGTSWTTTTGTGDNLSASDIRGVAARGNTLMATSANGLFRTTTGPLGTWTKISGSGGLPNAPALDLVGDPNNNNRLYVTFTGVSGGIYKTEDLGATWTDVTNGISTISADTAQFNLAVFNNGATSVVFAILNGTVDGELKKQLVYRSVNGAAFAALDSPTGDFSTSYDFGIAADKTSSNLVYVAGYGCLNPAPYKPVVYRLNATQASGSQATLLSTIGTYGTPHPDVNVLAVDATGGLWMGVHGGVFRLPDPASAASGANYWESKNGNLGVTEIHDIAYDHVSGVLAAGLQDNGVAFQSAPGNQTWVMAYGSGGDGGDVVVADIGGGQSARYASYQNLGGFRRYVYDAANALVSSASLSYAAVTDPQFVTPLAVNAVDPHRLLIGGSGHLYESLNEGGTITALAQPVGANRPSASAYGGYRGGVANPDVLYVGYGSKVYSRTAAGGAVQATAALPAGAGTVTDVVMNPTDWMNVFAVDDNQVFMSTDGGATWSDITGSLLFSGLSSDYIMAIEFVSGPSPYIVVGSRSGAFASLLSNLGTWVELGAGLPDVLVFELVYDAADDVLVAGTLGRAAWLLSDASAAFVPSSVAPVLAMTTAPTAANEGSTEYSYSFTVTDPGDQFTVTTLTVSAGGSLVPGSLSTTSSGGSFKVTFPDGPATVNITLQVTDSTGLLSNVASTSVTVANVKPTPIILGLPTSGSVGTPVNVTASATDPSAPDTTAGFTHAWQVDKLVGGTYYFFKSGSGSTFGFTPDASTTYRVWLKATDKDAGYLWTYKTFTAASPDLTADNVSLTVPEGLTAENSGTYAHKGPAPLTVSASVGTLSMAPDPTPIHFYRGNGNANDSAAGGAAGAINGAVTFAAGQVDQAFSFPGSGGAPSDTPNVQYPAAHLAPGTSDFSVAFGLKTTTSGSIQAVLGNRASASHDNFFVVWLGADGKLAVELDQDGAGTNYIGLTADVAVNDGLYHHIVATRSGTSVNLYLDGSLAIGGTSAGPTNITGANPFQLGAPQGAAAGTWAAYEGLLDEVRIYDQALSPEEIARDYDAFVAGNPAPSNALNVLGYWQLGEDDAGAAAGGAGNSPTLGRDGSGLNPALNLTGAGTYAAVDGANGSVLAMSFNGSTDAYTLGSPLTTATDNFGIEAWVKLNSTAGQQIIAYNGDGTYDGFGIAILYGNYQGLYGGVHWVDSGVAATAGAWHHVALVRDSGVTKYYLDGALAYSDSSSGPNPATTGFAVGRRPEGAVNFLNGAVDDARVFTFAPGTFDPQDLGINTSVAGTWDWSYTPDDGPTDSQSVAITASTGVPGDTTSLPFPLTVDNIAPTAVLGNGGAVDEGSTGTVSFSDQFDPSAADTAALHYAYDFDNDGAFEIGDGTYAGSGANASETVPASFLADGPGTRTVRGRILDKDGGYSDDTTDITINNAAPTASVSGPATGLVSQLVTFVIGASDPSAADQAAGFDYSIDWGDGSPPEAIARSEGNGATAASHAYAAANNYTIQVTATDQDGGTSPAPGSMAVTINTLDAASLQALIASAPIVYLAPADDAALQNAVAAINGLSDPGSLVDITIVLGAGPYSGVTLSPPNNVTLDLAGNYHLDIAGTPGVTTIVGASPALIVTQGEVFAQGLGLTTASDSPTVLVTGGHLTIRQNDIQESTGFNNAAVEATGGTVDLGLDMVTNINGEGAFFRSYDPDAIGFPTGVDADMVPNTYMVDGVPVSATKLSSTGLASAPAPSDVGEEVTFTATVDVEADDQGPATGTVSFYDGATLLGSGAVSKVGDEFIATFATSSLSEGAHTIRAVYSGNDVYVASSAESTQQVNAPTAVTLVRFDGRVMDDGSVLLEWQTASEVDLLGFYVYRAASETDTPVRLNADLIPGQSPGSPTGGDYSYQDQATAPGTTYYYWLEDVDAHGAATRYGPVSVTAESGRGFIIYLPLVSKD